MIRILIGDDHALIREGLKKIIREEPDLEVTGEASHPQEVLDFVSREALDVVVLDISMPDKSGLEVLKEIRQRKPKLPVLMLSMHPEDRFAVRALKDGASGYVTKESAPDELVGAIRHVHRGGKYVSASLAERLANEITVDASRPLHESLSDREFEVMTKLGAGKTPKQIAQELSLSISSVNTYRSRILDKMNMQTNGEVMRYAIKNGLVD